MNCIVYKMEELASIPEPAKFLQDYLSNPGSEFREKLSNGTAAGCIAVVFGDGGIMGWTRSEPWVDGLGGYWDTLEAFVDERFRGRGIASFAAKGLQASGYMEKGIVAVFDPKMMMVARSAGMFPTLFVKDGESKWVEV